MEWGPFRIGLQLFIPLLLMYIILPPVCDKIVVLLKVFEDNGRYDFLDVLFYHDLHTKMSPHFAQLSSVQLPPPRKFVWTNFWKESVPDLLERSRKFSTDQNCWIIAITIHCNVHTQLIVTRFGIHDVYVLLACHLDKI